MGRKFDDAEVQHLKAIAPFVIERASNGDAAVVLGDRRYSPPEISAMILQKLKADAEASLRQRGAPVRCITVPASFNDAQRQATQRRPQHRRASRCCG